MKPDPCSVRGLATVGTSRQPAGTRSSLVGDRPAASWIAGPPSTPGYYLVRCPSGRVEPMAIEAQALAFFPPGWSHLTPPST